MLTHCVEEESKTIPEKGDDAATEDLDVNTDQQAAWRETDHSSDGGDDYLDDVDKTFEEMGSEGMEEEPKESAEDELCESFIKVN